MIDEACKQNDHDNCSQPNDCPCQHRETVEIAGRDGYVYTAPKGVTQVDTDR